jgi:hypothetical protein
VDREDLQVKKIEFLGSKLIKNNKGQIAIESVLLMTILLGAFLAVTNYAKSKNLLSNMVQKPIQSLAIMSGYGVWKSGDADAGCKAPGRSSVTLGKCHPNSIARSLSSTPRL